MTGRDASFRLQGSECLMTHQIAPPMAALVRKLSAIFTLSDEERQMILGLPVMLRDVRPGHDIVREGDRPDKCGLVVSGWVCRYKATDEGRRQIVSLHIRGDIPDVQSLLLTEMDHSLGAITAAQIAFIAHDRLRPVTRSHPRLAEALWRETLIDASTYREWMLCLGRRSAQQRMGHLFCELNARLAAVDLADKDEYALPITQSVLGDALGLSMVHVNRSLQDLRADGLISWSQGRLKIHDRERLQIFSDFNPHYLHQLAA